ncbi:hypothetical protein [Winogradskyella tangerina]|uniref:hypothetical protein n=1 Tax=Winogradskyella tangerina TaxID=2023240 RepID=UPI000DBE76D3|nr:hypothetical protein [Winogradskyella tangerina]
MKINWHSDTQLSSDELDKRIQFEFDFRQKMTRFLMRFPILDRCQDFECYVFDYFVESQKIELSKDTAEPFFSNLKSRWHLFETGEKSA